MEKKFQELMPICPIRLLLRPNFHTAMMQRKHGLLVKVTNMEIIYQVLMVLVKLLVIFFHVTNILSVVLQ